MINIGDAWHFEDFLSDQTVVTAHRTVTEADLVSFVGFGGFYEQIFMMAAPAPENPFGQRVVPGYLTLVVAEGLLTLSGVMHNAVGLLGLNNAKWSKAVGCGDTISMTANVTEARPSNSRPDVGIVGFDHTVYNQADDIVLSYQTARFIRRRRSG